MREEPGGCAREACPRAACTRGNTTKDCTPICSGQRTTSASPASVGEELDAQKERRVEIIYDYGNVFDMYLKATLKGLEV